LTPDERVHVVAKLGFTERQARFLITVMRHGGVCVPRQYARFAGTAYGHRVNIFFDGLVRHGHVVCCDCVHNRAKLYHVRNRALYRAIGDADSRYRRPMAAGVVSERLMRLDAVVEHPDVRWLENDDERLAFLSEAAPNSAVDRLGQVPVRVRGRLRLVPDDVLIGVEPSGRAVFLVTIASRVTDALRLSLQGCGELLRTLPAWTLKLVYPTQFSTCIESFLRATREELETPLPTEIADDVRGYFEQLRSRARSHARGVDARFRQQQEAFAAPRFRVLYRRWLTDETALKTASSPAIRDAIAAGAGRIEWTVLPMQYEHLSPLASLVRPRPKGVEEGEEGGDTSAPPPQPPPLSSFRDPTGTERDWCRLVHRS
jgi:hypothetical protein